MKIEKPIFILGTGRCGSTVLHQMFSHHPNVSFLSGMCTLYPGSPQYNRLAMRLMDIPLVRRLARKKFMPAEHYGFWDYHVRGFSIPLRDLVANDVRPNEKKRITSVLSQMLTRTRDRLLVKITGWPRIAFLNEIFPDARFIHMLRDGRAVANSMINADFWRGWGGPSAWQFGDLSADQAREWERSGKSFVTLAGIQWKLLMDAFEVSKRAISPSQFLEIRYEDFANDPVANFQNILTFCELDFPSGFKDFVRDYPVESTNYKWKRDLTDRQYVELDRCLADYLARHHYESKEQESCAPPPRISSKMG